MTDKLIRRGFGLKSEVIESLEQDYLSNIINLFKAHDYTITAGNTTFKLAREFGFCYGVDRAIEYTYQTLKKFPGKRLFLTGEIIHNPFVNNKMLELGVRFLSGPYSQGETIANLQPEDIVILPAFGVSVELQKELQETGCILVDTTCGSVLNVWKNVEKFTREGHTAVVHGKYYHEETIATVSRTTIAGGGKYLVVRNLDETQRVCDYIRNPQDETGFYEYFARAMSPGFDPVTDLVKVGVANQTTMLSKESLEVAAMLERALADRYGAENLEAHFRSFDTICSATQDRQDALLELLETSPDLSVVIGGYNSSNTNNLANIAIKYGPTYHIEDVNGIDDNGVIHHKKAGTDTVLPATGWLPDGPVTVAVTAGASTPNNKIGEVVVRIAELHGDREELDQLMATAE